MEQVHYFTDNCNLSSNRIEHAFVFMGNSYRFVTDRGVFSKDGVDYGTAVLLRLVAQEKLEGPVLDLGCGYGVVGIVVKTLFPQCVVTSSDVNSRAIDLTQCNAERNHVQITTILSNGFSSIPQQFQCVLTNPPIRAGKQIIYQMFDDAYAHLEKNGLLLVVIRKKQGAESAVRKLEAIFGNCEVVERDKGFWILRCVKLN